MKIKSRRGEVSFASEIFRIVLAVIALGLLVIFASKLYSILGKRGAGDIAKATLEELKGKIDGLETSGVDVDYIVTGPKDWYLVYYDSNKNQNMPSVCGKACLCMCPCSKTDYSTLESSLIQSSWSAAEAAKNYFNTRTCSEGDNRDYNTCLFFRGFNDCDEDGICENINPLNFNVIVRQTQEVGSGPRTYTDGVANWISLSRLPITLELKKRANTLTLSPRDYWLAKEYEK